MSKLLWEVKELVCDNCKERPIKKVVEISKGNWKGLCVECILKKEEGKYV